MQQLLADQIAQKNKLLENEGVIRYLGSIEDTEQSQDDLPNDEDEDFS